MLHNLKGWMEQARLEAHTAARDRKLTEVALANKPVEPASVPPPEPTPLGLGDLFERLVDELAKRVASEVAKALSEQLSVKPVPDTFEHTYKHVEYGVKGLIEAQTPATPKVRRKRVLIIGLKGQQVTVVEQKYPDIDFTFMTSDEAQGRSPGEADWTIMMTKFINHAVYSKYRHVPNMHHCNGGVSDLGGIIQTIRNS
jgi:hypothetical protein